MARTTRRRHRLDPPTQDAQFHFKETRREGTRCTMMPPPHPLLFRLRLRLFHERTRRETVRDAKFFCKRGHGTFVTSRHRRSFSLFDVSLPSHWIGCRLTSSCPSLKCAIGLVRSQTAALPFFLFFFFFFFSSVRRQRSRKGTTRHWIMLPPPPSLLFF